MTHQIAAVSAQEILDSRSRPTLSVAVDLVGGAAGTAGVPSGASTGSREAVELRDGDPGRFGGEGVLGAVANVNGEIATALDGRSFESLADLDRALCDLDGTDTKGRLGANAIVVCRWPRRGRWPPPTSCPCMSGSHRSGCSPGCRCPVST